MQNMSGIAGSPLKDKIISILTVHHPLSAKKIYLRLKNNFQVSVTYQGVHKAIQELLSSGIISTESLEYQISLKWLNNIHNFATQIKEDYRNKDFLIEEIKAISFDLGGCISDNTFDERIWRKEIPMIYAKERNVPFNVAVKEVSAEYKRLWGKINGWRNPDFWFNHFNFKESSDDMMLRLQDEVTLYTDVISIFKELSSKFDLVIISRADRKFLDFKLKNNNLNKYIKASFSTISDFNEYGKNTYVYQEMLRKLGLQPSQLIHVGDSHELDYRVPTSLGIKSFIIDRMGDEKKKYIVRDLFEFREACLNSKQS